MNIKEIESHSEFQELINSTKRLFLLLYKSESAQSDCALVNLRKLKLKDINLVTADVASVRDIHEKYNIYSVPTLLEFENGKLKNTLKGCHEEDFIESFFMNSLYSSSHKSDQVKSKRVVVYTTPTCPHCTTIKNYLKEQRIAYKDIDVSKDQRQAEQMIKKSGQQGVPQIEINGRIIVGFNKPKIDELLEIK